MSRGGERRSGKARDPGLQEEENDIIGREIKAKRLLRPGDMRERPKYVAVTEARGKEGVEGTRGGESWSELTDRWPGR